MKYIYKMLILSSFVGILMFFAVVDVADSSSAIAQSTPSFSYSFGTNGTLEEASTPTQSSSAYFWLKSGGVMTISNGVGATNQGSLPATNKWRVAYAASSSVQTDNGYHPQNVFKLFTRSAWQNVRHTVSFNIQDDNLTNIANRHPYDGVFLIDRYDMANDSYYMMGFRTDGAGVLKKKVGDKFYTLQYSPLFFVGDDSGDYDSASRFNMLLKNTWIMMRSEIRNNANGTVDLQFYYNYCGFGWILAGFATDDGVLYGPVLGGSGLAGVQSDFMDVQYDDYALEGL